MITLPTGTKIWIIAGITDMRCGFNGLASKVQNTLKDDPFSGHIFVFRGRSGKMVKILWADRDGLCLFAKRLAGDPGRESTPDASSVIHATGGDRVATSQTDRTA
ncbi:transposase, partial [Shigella flexneri]|nr:transposase [Shigella flexneri]